MPRVNTRSSSQRAEAVRSMGLMSLENRVDDPWPPVDETKRSTEKKRRFFFLLVGKDLIGSVAEDTFPYLAKLRGANANFNAELFASADDLPKKSFLFHSEQERREITRKV